MMNRRNLFARLLAGAAAFVVAPAVTVEAGPKTEITEDMVQRIAETQRMTGHALGYARARHEAEALIAEARAEGYERGRAIEQARFESRQADDLEFVPFYEQDGLRVLAPKGSRIVIELPPQEFESRQAEPWHYTGVHVVEVGGTEPVSRAYGESVWIRRQGVPRPAGNLRALEVHADGDALTAAAGALRDLGLLEPIAYTREVRITS